MYEQKQPEDPPPIACRLSGEERLLRRKELSRRILAECESVVELADGYELRFSGNVDQANELVRFIVSERECCPFLCFELTFEANDGPISLRIRGPEGTKQVIGEGLL